MTEETSKAKYTPGPWETELINSETDVQIHLQADTWRSSSSTAILEAFQAT